MRCGKAKERLWEYIEGTLKGSSLRVLEEHLRSCQDCRRELASLRELDTRLRREAPKYWENIEPAPDFSARLSRLDFPFPMSKLSSVVEALSALWRKNHLVLAAGLSACVIIALVFTIPRMISTVGKAPVASEKPSPQYAQEGKITREVLAVKGMESEVPKGVPAEKGAVEGVESKATSVANTVPEGTFKTYPRGAAESETEQRELAIEIALKDLEVQETIKGRNYRVIGVYLVPSEEDFICAGITVLLALEEADPLETVLHICVDLDKREVVKMMLVPGGELMPNKR